METNKLKSKMRSKPRTKTSILTLEDYLQCLHSPSNYDLINLGIAQLNQIISMYGYKKIYKYAKKVLLEAVSTLTLVDLSRSTLKINISPHAFQTLEDVLADLDDLNWKECCVTSIQTLSSMNRCLAISSAPPDPTMVNYDQPNPHSTNISSFQPQAPQPNAPKATAMSYVHSVSAMDEVPSTGRRRVKKTLPLSQVNAADGAPSTDPRIKKSSTKRKKSSFKKVMSSGDNGNNDLALDCISFGSC